MREVAPAATGRRLTQDGREWLVHTRMVRADAPTVWAALTDPERLAQWIGTWRRLPDRTMEFLLAFEGDDLLPAVYRLVAYDAGRSFTVSVLDPGATEPSQVQVQVTPAARGTQLTLGHTVTNVALLPHLAAGCEYYLDRLVGLVERRRTHGPSGPETDDFDEYFLAQAAHYRQLFPLPRNGSALGS
jgi:uncharacterized protein YndB with AHSA1/START domain